MRIADIFIDPMLLKFKTKDWNFRKCSTADCCGQIDIKSKFCAYDGIGIIL